MPDCLTASGLAPTAARFVLHPAGRAVGPGKSGPRIGLQAGGTNGWLVTVAIAAVARAARSTVANPMLRSANLHSFWSFTMRLDSRVEG